MQCIALANHKGGVGKTATTHALGAILAEGGRRVLMLDLDPQASLTLAAGVTDAGDADSLADVLGGAQPGRLDLRAILRPLADGLALAPADISMAATELALTSRLGREAVLRKALATVAESFDVVLIDCPPSLGLLTVNALTAADGVIVPAQPAPADLRAVRLFLESIGQIREALNPRLQLVGVLLTFFDRRLALHCNALQSIAAAGLPLFAARIGRSVRIAEAMATGQAVTAYDPRNPQSAAYRQLGEEIAAWLERSLT